jgi:hypothetical protein
MLTVWRRVKPLSAAMISVRCSGTTFGLFIQLRTHLLPVWKTHDTDTQLWYPSTNWG